MLCMIVSEVRVEATSLQLGAGHYPLPMGLDPVERLWLYLRERFLSHRLLDDSDAIVDTCCRAWNQLTAERVQTLRNYPCTQQVALVATLLLEKPSQLDAGVGH